MEARWPWRGTADTTIVALTAVAFAAVPITTTITAAAAPAAATSISFINATVYATMAVAAKRQAPSGASRQHR